MQLWALLAGKQGGHGECVLTELWQSRGSGQQQERHHNGL